MRLRLVDRGATYDNDVVPVLTRPGLREALAYAKEGDVLPVWKCDALSWLLAHLIETVQEAGGTGYRVPLTGRGH